MALNRPVLVILLLLIIAVAADPRVAALASAWQRANRDYEVHLNHVEKIRPGTRAWIAAGD